MGRAKKKSDGMSYCEEMMTFEIIYGADMDHVASL